MAAKGMMRAVQYDGFGGGAAALKHVEVPIPSPKKDEVLLKLEAASLNPLDWKFQQGEMLDPLFPLACKVSSIPWQPGQCKFPYIPVSNVAGEVIEVGSEVTDFKAGDKVVSLLYFLDGGGLAEYVVASTSLTVHRPSKVTATHGAGLPIAGLSALQALKYIGLKFDNTGQTKNVLITAASGGVGHYAVQLAKLGNLHVTATCGARNINLLRSLGADEILDYKTPEGESLRSPSGKIYDLVIHCAMGIGWSTFEPYLGCNAMVLDLSPTVQSMLTYASKKLMGSKEYFIPFMMVPNKKELEFLVGLMKEGKLKTVVDSTYPLSKVQEAWSRSMGGHATGKIIVEI